MGVLARWLPAHPDAARVRTLAETGLVAPIELDDRAAAALLRELYAAGAPPTLVALRPTDATAQRRLAEASPAFAAFARRGGRFVPTWSWGAFILGPLWYLRRGLYAKGLVLLALSVCPLWTLSTTMLVSAVVLVYCGVMGNWDHYLWKIEQTQWW
jgi:hypothetical protein